MIKYQIHYINNLKTYLNVIVTKLKSELHIIVIIIFHLLKKNNEIACH